MDGGGGYINPKEGDSDCKFETYSIIGCNWGTNLTYGMLYYPLILENKEKEGDNISGNRLINPQNLTANIEKF